MIKVLLTTAVLAQSMVAANFWDCQTNGVDGGHASTQEGAAANWLAHFQGKFVQSRPCGELGTSSYNICPVSGSDGEDEGNMDVSLVCMPGGVRSPDGVNCPGQYYVSTDVAPLVGEGCGTEDGGYDGSRSRWDGRGSTEWWYDCKLKIVADVPYSASYSKTSPLYPDAAATCMRGWSQVAVISSPWAKATVTYAKGTCWLSLNGSVVGSIVVYNAAAKR